MHIKQHSKPPHPHINVPAHHPLTLPLQNKLCQSLSRRHRGSEILSPTDFPPRQGSYTISFSRIRSLARSFPGFSPQNGENVNKGMLELIRQRQ